MFLSQKMKQFVKWAILGEESVSCKNFVITTNKKFRLNVFVNFEILNGKLKLIWHHFQEYWCFDSNFLKQQLFGALHQLKNEHWFYKNINWLILFWFIEIKSPNQVTSWLFICHFFEYPKDANNYPLNKKNSSHFTRKIAWFHQNVSFLKTMFWKKQKKIWNE